MQLKNSIKWSRGSPSNKNTVSAVENHGDTGPTYFYIFVKVVSTISKDDRKTPKGTDPAEENLTPWQKANREYLKKQEAEGSWTPKVIDGTNESSEEGPSEGEPMEGEYLDENGEYQGAPRTDSFADTLPKIKQQRSSVLYRRLGLIILILLIPLFAALYYVSPLSKLSQVSVSGTEAVKPEAIITASGFETGADMWPQYFDREKNEAAIKQANPRIKSVSLGIERLNQFHLKVTEYPEVALLAKNDQYHPILANGKVLDETMKNPTENMPILEDFDSDKKILSVLQQYQKLSQEIRKGISQIKYSPSDSNKELLTIFMNDQNQVIVNISNLAKQMKYYPQVAKDLDGKGVIDMEVGIYSYKYQDETAESGEEGTETSSEGNENTQQVDENTLTQDEIPADVTNVTGG